MSNQLTPINPYLIRATHEWIEDNNGTPHLIVDATTPDVEVPQQFVNDGQIILNIGSTSVVNLEITNEAVSFGARFNKVPENIYVPIHAIQIIFDRESQQTMPLPPINIQQPQTKDNTTQKAKPSPLSVVK